MTTRWQQDAEFRSGGLDAFAKKVAAAYEANRSEFAPVYDAVRTIAAAIGEHQLGSYGLVVGDDTSGRLPALILRAIMNRVRERDGHPKVPIVFLQTGSYKWLSEERQEKAWARRAEIWSRLAGQRALVVTEYMATGEHLAQFSKLLGEAAIPFDVATLGSEGLSSKVIATSQVPDDTHIFDGEGGLLLYRKPHLTGLSHEKHGEPKRERVPRECVAAARLHVKTIAEKVDERLQQGLS